MDVFGAVALVQFFTGVVSHCASKAAGQLHVFGQDSDSPGVHGAQVGVFHQTDEVGLGGLLESEEGMALEAKILANACGN